MITSKMLLLLLLHNNNLNIDTTSVETEQLYCLTMNIYHEARGEDFDGKLAVANVTKNRVNDTRYPNTFCEVVKQGVTNHLGEPKLNKCHFSWYCDGNSDKIILRKDKKWHEVNYNSFKDSSLAAMLVISNIVDDTTHGATHYYNSKLADPNWADLYTFVVDIGNHSFYRREPNSSF